MIFRTCYKSKHRSARDHGKEKNSRYFYFPSSFARKFSSKESRLGATTTHVRSGLVELIWSNSANWALIDSLLEPAETKSIGNLSFLWDKGKLVFRMKIWTLKNNYIMNKLNKDLPFDRPALIQLSELTGRRLAHEVTETSGHYFVSFMIVDVKITRPLRVPPTLSRIRLR